MQVTGFEIDFTFFAGTVIQRWFNYCPFLLASSPIHRSATGAPLAIVHGIANIHNMCVQLDMWESVANVFVLELIHEREYVQDREKA